MLEFAYFKSRERATQFFLHAKEAAQLSSRNALEVFYICVVLGFRGLYALPDSSFLAEQLELPSDVEAWAKRTSRALQLGVGRPPITDSLRPGDGAPPLEARFALVGASMIGLILTAFTIVIGYFVVTSSM